MRFELHIFVYKNVILQHLAKIQIYFFQNNRNRKNPIVKTIFFYPPLIKIPCYKFVLFI